MLPLEIKEQLMDKLDRLYTEVLKSYSKANESNREEFKMWFVRNDMYNFIMTFLRNDLNIKATSKRLFLGRSTVMFRLERIKYFMGLDIRKFTDALKMVSLFLSCGLS